MKGENRRVLTVLRSKERMDFYEDYRTELISVASVSEWEEGRKSAYLSVATSRAMSRSEDRRVLMGKRWTQETGSEDGYDQDTAGPTDTVSSAVGRRSKRTTEFFTENSIYVLHVLITTFSPFSLEF